MSAPAPFPVAIDFIIYSAPGLKFAFNPSALKSTPTSIVQRLNFDKFTIASLTLKIIGYDTGFDLNNSAAACYYNSSLLLFVLELESALCIWLVSVEENTSNFWAIKELNVW